MAERARDTAGDSEDAVRVLVVDDVLVNRELLRRRLVRRGFVVDEAAGGREALERIETGGYDVVLLDIMMPDLDGIEVVREVRRTRSAEALPIIMVSAKSLSEDVDRSLSVGANDYITKPIDFAATLASIETHVARARNS